MAWEFFDSLRNFMQQQQPLAPAAPVPPNFLANKVVEQFRRMQPLHFKGNEGPMETEEWIAELERIYKHMGLTDA